MDGSGVTEERGRARLAAGGRAGARTPRTPVPRAQYSNPEPRARTFFKKIFSFSQLVPSLRLSENQER